MKFATWLLVLVLIVGIFSTHRSVRRSRSEAERAFALRLALFSRMATVVFVIALMFLPNRQRVLTAKSAGGTCDAIRSES